MSHPVFALVWECWRLSRRWYLWVLPLAFVIDLTFLMQADAPGAMGPPGMSSATRVHMLLAPSAFMLNFTLAIFASMLAMSIGSRTGFPLTFEFRLPLSTSVLVAVPMLTLASLCASLYFLPMLILGVVYDIPFPLLPACMLIGTLVCILLTCSWIVTTTGSRTFAVIFGLIGAVQLFAMLEPVQLRWLAPVPGQPLVFNSEIVSLSAGEYGLLVCLCLLLFAIASTALRAQRCGETFAIQVPGLRPAAPRQRSFSLAALLDRAPDVFALPCPMSSPLRAELWLEMKRQITPVLLLSVLVAGIVPVVFMLGLMPTRDGLTSADYFFPGVVFFAGVAIAVFNRRQTTAGYMSAFEGTRGMSTLQLASIQMLSVAAATLLGMVIVCASFYFSSPLLDEPSSLVMRMQRLGDAWREQTPLHVFAGAVMQLTMYLSLVTLLACVHTWAVVWGRWVPYGAGVLAIYGLIFTSRVQSQGPAMLDSIKQHMWGFALVVFALTLLACARTVHLKILSLRSSVFALLCWGAFVAASLYELARQDIVLSRQAPELQAFNSALFLLPLLLFALLLWSYDRLRHR